MQEGTRAFILELEDLPRKQVFVSEWKCSVWVKTLSGSERDAWELEVARRAKTDEQFKKNIRASFVAMCVCDKDGKAMFTMDDIPALGKKSGAALDKIWDVSHKLNHLRETDIEELVKN